LANIDTRNACVKTSGGFECGFKGVSTACTEILTLDIYTRDHKGVDNS